MTYATAWALGNRYWILRQESIHHSGTPSERISSTIPSGQGFPLWMAPFRTASMNLNAFLSSMPLELR